MEVFSVPSRYAAEVEAAVRRAVEVVRMDIWRRQNGQQPLVPDMAIDAAKRGETVILVGLDADRLVSCADRVRMKRATA